MAKIDILAPFILSFEGGYANDKDDKGGATKHGVTLATWRVNGYDKNGDGRIDEKDVMQITEADAIRIMKKNFWDVWQADLIHCQSLANILVDWVWASGKYGITIPQEMLGVKPDGKVGPKTLEALNKQDSWQFFQKLKVRRKKYLQDIVKARPKNYKYLKGWQRRLDGIRYGSLVYNSGKEVRF